MLELFMLQIAVFIDAGYLYAQGSVLIAGSRQDRRRVRLNVPTVLSDLTGEARSSEPDARLLRIYWYDGLPRGGILSLEQKNVARSENVKCRFGTINGRGEQKGVDSLIVTDLIELARNQSISDALILSGDEDLRIGVQIAQTFGIRVHLLGIHPARGSQSPDLLDEADTTREWGQDKVAAWLTVVGSEAAHTDTASTAQSSDKLELRSDSELIADVKLARVDLLSHDEACAVFEYAQANRNQLPSDFDRPALGAAKLKLARELTDKERRDFRRELLESIRSKIAPLGT